MATPQLTEEQKILKKIKKNLQAILSDSQLGNNNPFELLIEEEEFPSKKHVESLWNNIYEYYKRHENWSNDGDFLEFESIPEYILELARRNGVESIDEETLKKAGGYLSSKWLVFVPFTKTIDAFSAFTGDRLSRNHRKLASNFWISNILADENVHFKWIYKMFSKELRGDKVNSWKAKRSDFHHQLCQIGGAKYGPRKVTSGHYFIFRFNGSISSLTSKHDPSTLFVLFCRGVWAIKSKGKSIVELMATTPDHHILTPDGIIGVSLKDFLSWRYKRNTLVQLNIPIDDKFLKSLSKVRFGEVGDAIFVSNGKDSRWENMKYSADVMYQFLENESVGGNAYTKKALSTVLLCSASEAMLKINNRNIKRNLSTLIATLLEPRGGEDHKNIYDFFERAYKVRSKFVHEGVVDYVDNKKLFYYVFSAWLKLCHYYLDNNQDKNKTYNDYLKEKLSKNSKVYSEIFFKDYIG